MRSVFRHAADGRGKRLAALLCLLLAGPTAASAALDFELASAGPGATTGFLRLSSLPAQATLVNFWRSDCPPCLRELPLLNRFAAEHPEIRVISIALQKPSETLFSPLIPKPPVLSLHGPSQPQGLLARFGNRIGALPFSVWLTPGRESCAQQIGEISAEWLERSRRRCLPDAAH